jgi:NAD(P)-dependent dehydrogenase (short-subunit alcohol dehydrogenase family)
MPNSLLLQNHIIFLTGGSTGIGRECAIAYAKEGATVAIADINGSGAQKAATELGPGHIGIQCDVSSSSAVEAAVSRTLSTYGRLDAIHNNAGIASPSKPLDETTEQEWDALFNTNLKSILHTTHYGLEALKKTHGCILNTSSVVGVIGQAAHAAYSATKGGMNALTKSMALDYAHYGVRVNAVCPAGIWTPMLRQWASEQGNPDQINGYLNDIHALGYCPQGDVVADVCVFLLSQKARFITGHIMHISGGAELGYRR